MTITRGLQERVITFDGRGDQWAETGSGLVIPSYAAPPPKPVAVDLFAGCGGMSLGFHQAGFDVAAASEWDVDAMCTYLCNLGGPDTLIVPLNALPTTRKAPGAPVANPLTKASRCADAMPNAGTGWISGSPDQRPCRVFFFGDVRLLTGRMVLDALGLDEVDAVVGGPPCQGFSRANAKKPDEKRHDPRNQLVFEFARLVLECHAKTFVMENVPAMTKMLTPEGIPVIDALARIFADGGFGTYDALRRSIAANAGAGGAVRQEHPAPGAGEDEPPELAGQTSLFDEATA